MQMTPHKMPAVGLAGLGRMGRAIAAALASSGLLAAVHNRTWQRGREAAAALGVPACRTAAELAAASDVLITVVADGDAVLQLYKGPDGLLGGLRPGTLCLEMSTIGPEAIERLAGRVHAAGCALVDAPVSGSTAMAARGELTILAGGEPGDLERARPVLDALGRRTLHVGPLGSGATMKLAVNNVVYGLNQSIAESLVLAERAGIARERAYEAFADSAVAAPFVHYRRELFERPGEQPAQMRLDLAAKDVALIEALAARVGARLPQAAVNGLVMRDAASAGRGSQDVTAVAAYLRDAR
jgi:3-hydroxyisobutyrate dehydrogenase/2-hydroxy-3-oxopropionate reductase